MAWEKGGAWMGERAWEKGEVAEWHVGEWIEGSLSVGSDEE